MYLWMERFQRKPGHSRPRSFDQIPRAQEEQPRLGEDRGGLPTREYACCIRAWWAPGACVVPKTLGYSSGIGFCLLQQLLLSGWEFWKPSTFGFGSAIGFCLQQLSLAKMEFSEAKFLWIWFSPRILPSAAFPHKRKFSEVWDQCTCTMPVRWSSPRIIFKSSTPWDQHLATTTTRISLGAAKRLPPPQRASL